MSKISRSLQTKLSVGILLMAIPVFVLSLGLLFVQSCNYIRQEASEHASSLLTTTMHRVKKYLLTVETAANANTWFIEQSLYSDSLQAITRRIVELNRNIHDCTVITDPEKFPKLTDADGCWIDPVKNIEQADLNEAVLTYCKPLYGKDKEQIAGILCTELSFKMLDAAINATDPEYPNAYFIMLGGDGRYFVHPDSTRLLQCAISADIHHPTPSDITNITLEMMAGKEGIMHAKVNGRLCHVTYMPVISTKWSIALICPESEILKSYNQLPYIIIALIVVGLAFILWLCRRAVGNAVQPIRYLLGMSQQIAKGHYDIEIPHTKREDAIGQLQNSFAKMQKSIEERIGSIRQTTEETQRRNEELVTAMKMAEEGLKQKTLFIQNVLHQIRTPLNIILGFSEVLHNSQDLPEKELQDIRGMMTYNAMHLNRMILMLFDSSDTGASEDWKSQRTDTVSCNQMARDCVSYTQEHFPGLHIRFESEEPDSLCIQTNYLYLMRSLRELLYNAAKYSDGKHISMRVWQTEASVRFTIEDVGPGIPKESLENIFKPFQKVDDLSEGLGLGLSLSRRHIISLGGDLELDTNYHDGCRFNIIMPK